MALGRKAISPVIATVIIVAVAIAISIAVAGWIMGLWSGFGQTESIKIFPDSYAVDDGTNGYLVLHLQNVGGSPAQIYKIEVAGYTITDQDGNVIYVNTQDPTAPIDPNQAVSVTPNASLPYTIDPGEELYMVVVVTDPNGAVKFASGVAYTVTIYTAAGNVYTATVYGKGTQTTNTTGGGGTGG